MLSHMISNEGNISFVTSDGYSKYVDVSHKNYHAIMNALGEGDDELVMDLLEDTSKLTAYFENSAIRVDGGVLYYNDEIIENSIVDRIMKFYENKLPYMPLVRFLEKLLNNTSAASVRELYDFLSNEKLPITEDGDFLAYKAVREDFMDIYSGKVEYKLGTSVEMPRRNVDDDRARGCSYGLHAGSIDYVHSYGGSTSKKLIVKINPADVVSVPSEDCRKLRTCKLFVLCEYLGDLEHPLYQNDGSDFVDDDSDEDDNYSSFYVDDDYEDDYDDDDDDNDDSYDYFGL